jgi:heme A synthase
MYTTVLVIHSWVRWVALVGGIGATFAALRRQNATAERWALVTMMTLDIQLLLGLLLYLVVSPNMAAIRASFGESMRDPVARFWAVEHLTAMLAAVILAHVGRVLARKAKTPDALRLRLLVCFGLATVLMIVGMPWPGRPGGRPLLRI